MYDLLKGMRIIEGAAFIAGPSCSLHFSQLGAEVIRFDAIGGAPDRKRWPLSSAGCSLYWEGLNKGKKSILIDFSRQEGRELAQRLAVSGDGLFVTNYPVGGFLSHDLLRQQRADLICLRIMGWADGSPAVDYTVNAAVGLPTMTGPADDLRPVNHVLPAWDLLAGAYGAFSLLAAERERRHSGKGREIRLALADLAAATVGHLGQVAEVLQRGEDRERCGNELYGAFGRDFSTSDGQRLMIVAITARQWLGLLKVLDLREAVAAIEARLQVDFTNDEGARFVHRAHLLPLVEAAIAARPGEELGAAFDQAGVCWSRYQTPAQAVTSDERLFLKNPIFSNISHPSGCYPTPGFAAQLPQDARLPAAPAHRLGADTDEILATCLGMSQGEIGRLRDSALVA